VVIPTEDQGIAPKATWAGLTEGGDWNTPLQEFVGKLISHRTEAGKFGAQVVFAYELIQTIRTDAPYPKLDVEVWINFSTKKNSAWAKFGESIATVLDIALEQIDPDVLVGKNLHMVRHDNVPYGFNDKETGKPATGKVWELVAIIADGAQATPIPVTETPATLTPIPPSGGAPTATEQMEALSGTTRALELLNGKTQSEFFQAALSDPIVQTDNALALTITGNTFITTQIAEGKVILGADGKHSVVNG
jgi:hypothetical protein